MNLKKWDEIHRGSKITLNQDTLFNSICEGEGDFTIPKGTYWINGFWVNACGIGLTRQDAYDLNNKYLIASVELRKFAEVV